MHPAVQLIRLGNVLVSFAGTLVGGAVALRLSPLPSGTAFALVLLAALSTALVTAGGNVLNDLLDRESDRVNHPDRPLVTGRVSVRTARASAAGALVASAVAMIPVAWFEPLVGAIYAIAVGVLLAYEFRGKASGLTGNLFVAFLTGAVFLYGGAAGGNAPALAVFALMAFGATLSREVIKDMEDATGDVGRRTLPRTRGMGPAAWAARVSVLGAIALSGVPFLLFLPFASVAGIMYLVFVLAADALFVVSVVHLPERLHWEQTVSKLAMTVALVAFIAAAFR